MNLNKASLTAPSPQTSQTAEQHRASERKKTGKETFSWQQGDSRTRPSRKGRAHRPGIERDSLLSIPKFADANYVAIFDKDEVNIYDANKTTIVVSRGAILRGWRCKQTKLWRIPLIKNVTNENTDTVLCD